VAHCICADTLGARGAVGRAYDVRLQSHLAVVRPRARHTRSTAALSEQDATIVGRVKNKAERSRHGCAIHREYRSDHPSSRLNLLRTHCGPGAAWRLCRPMKIGV